MTDEVKVEVKPTHVVIDNSNLEAVLANARGEDYVPEEKTQPNPEVKEEPKKEVKDTDDLGLTPEQLEDTKLTETVRKAIDRKHRKFKEAEEFAQTQFNEKQLALKRAEALERELARLKDLNTPKVEEPKKPTKADFKTDEEYIEAIADWKAGERIKAKEAEDHKRAQEERQREIVATAQSRIAKAKEIVPDWDDVMSKSEMEVPVDIAGYLQESELFAELGYHLAKNPEVLEKISKLSPAKQLVEIGKIESTLKPFSEKSEKVETGAKPEKQDGKAETPPSTDAKASKARPEPIKPLETGSVSQVTKPESEMTYEEAKAHFQKTHKVNFSARKRH